MIIALRKNQNEDREFLAVRHRPEKRFKAGTALLLDELNDLLVLFSSLIQMIVILSNSVFDGFKDFFPCLFFLGFGLLFFQNFLKVQYIFVSVAHLLLTDQIGQPIDFIHSDWCINFLWLEAQLDEIFLTRLKL